MIFPPAQPTSVEDFYCFIFLKRLPLKRCFASWQIGHFIAGALVELLQQKTSSKAPKSSVNHGVRLAYVAQRLTPEVHRGAGYEASQSS